MCIYWTFSDSQHTRRKPASALETCIWTVALSPKNSPEGNFRQAPLRASGLRARESNVQRQAR